MQRHTLRGAIWLAGLGRRHYHNRMVSSLQKHSINTRLTGDKDLLFVHIPKCAGTSIYASFGLPKPYDTHVPATAYMEFMNGSFESSNSFTIIRNPWDRLVSAFHYLKRRTDWQSDSQFSDSVLKGVGDFNTFTSKLSSDIIFRNKVISWRHFVPQSYFITDFSGRILVNDVLRFETLDEGIEQLRNKYGISNTSEFLHVNSTRKRPYQEYYDDASKNFVAKLYAEDIAIGEYRFAE